MTAQLQIDQFGLGDGVPGRSRTDGIPNGAVVTLTNTGAGSSTEFILLWTPPGDTTAVASLGPTEEDPKVWSFTPTAGKYGSYLVQLIENAGLPSERRERRIIAMRTPNLGLVVPALNERGYRNASLEDTSGSEVADNNAIDYPDADLNEHPSAAWWRALHELIMAVDSSGSGGGGGSGLPDGSIIGQVVVWDGSTWIPLEPGQPLVADRFQSETSMLFEPAAGEFRVTAISMSLDATFVGGGKLSIDGGTVALHGSDMGFFDATPIERPVLTAGDGDAIEQVISALVALGLITDNR